MDKTFPAPGLRMRITRMVSEMDGEFEHDDDCMCYRVRPPAGYTFDGDLHEFVAPYGRGCTGPTKTDALTDLADRLDGVSVTKCDTTDCDWCRSE